MPATNDHSEPKASDALTSGAPVATPVSAGTARASDAPSIVPAAEPQESADTAAAQRSARSSGPISARGRAGDATDVLPKDAAPGSLSKRQRRGAFIAGAISLPLVSVGLVTLGVPLLLWYASTVFRSIAVVVSNAFGGRTAAEDANEVVQQVNLSSLSQASLWLAVAGLVVVLAGVLVSLFVLRGHGVARPWGITIVALPMGLTISTVLTLLISSLSGFLFRDTASVSGILANSALGAVGSVLASLVVTVLVGLFVWHWMVRLYRATVRD